MQEFDPFVAAKDGSLPKEFADWGLKNEDGETVAHEAARFGGLPSNFSQWDLLNDQGVPVACVAAEKGCSVPSDAWHLADKGGYTVAHYAAFSDNKDLLKDFKDWGLKTNYGESVALIAAQHGNLDLDSDGWMVKNRNGDTPGHVLVKRGCLPYGFKQWDLTNNDGVSVKDDFRSSLREIDTQNPSKYNSEKARSFLNAFLTKDEINGLSDIYKVIALDRLKDAIKPWSKMAALDNGAFFEANPKKREGIEKQYFTQKTYGRKDHKDGLLNRDRPSNFIEMPLAIHLVKERRLPEGFKNWGISFQGLTVAHIAAEKRALPKGFDQWDLKGRGSLSEETVIERHSRFNGRPTPEGYGDWFSKKMESDPGLPFKLIKCLPDEFNDWSRRGEGNKGNTVAHSYVAAAGREVMDDRVAPGFKLTLSQWHEKNDAGERVIDVALKNQKFNSEFQQMYAQAEAEHMSASIGQPPPGISYKEATQALRDGTLPADFNDWSKKNSDGWTLAHAAAALGKLPPDFKDWGMEGAKPGITVAHIAMRYSELPPSFNDWGIKDASGKTLGEVAVKHPKLGAEYRERIEASKQAQQPKLEAGHPEPQAAKPSSEAQAQGGKSNQAAPIETSSTGRITGGGRFSRPPDLSNREPEPERRPIKAFISRGM